MVVLGGGNKQTTKPTNKIINGIENKTKEQSITTFSNTKVVWNMMSGKGLQASYCKMLSCYCHKIVLIVLMLEEYMN